MKEILSALVISLFISMTSFSKTDSQVENKGIDKLSDEKWTFQRLNTKEDQNQSDLKGSGMWAIEEVIRPNVDKRRKRPQTKTKDSYLYTTLVQFKENAKDKTKQCSIKDIYDTDQYSGTDPDNKEKLKRVRECHFVKVEGFCYNHESKTQFTKELIAVYRDMVNLLPSM